MFDFRETFIDQCRESRGSEVDVTATGRGLVPGEARHSCPALSVFDFCEMTIDQRREDRGGDAAVIAVGGDFRSIGQ